MCHEALRLILIDNEVVLAGRYTSRSGLTRWAGIQTPAAYPA
ncbi:MAG: arsenic metallochaperone ArsD family protein [Alcaligenaceae bacterium]|nr:arsenic metallochaperone ArsD family protein [Alcaligenaceae bacterium]